MVTIDRTRGDTPGTGQQEEARGCTLTETEREGLVEAYRPLLYATITKLRAVARRAGWEWSDLEQTGYVCLIELIADYDSTGGVASIGSYLKKMLPYRVYNAAKAQARRRVEDVPIDDRIVAADRLTRETATDVWIRSRGLTDREADALVLIYCHDQTQEDVAAVLGCHVDTVRRIRNRALEKLRAQLDSRF